MSKNENKNEDGNKKDFSVRFKNKKNKHTLDGKHSLEHDYFKGIPDKNKHEDDDLFDFVDDLNELNTTDFSFQPENCKIESGSLMEDESTNNEEYVIRKDLEEDIYEILDSEMNVDFLQNRRKPNREFFNSCYEILVKKLEPKYTKCEIFVSLSYYFTDNIFNMFKLLDKKYATSLIVELKNKGYLSNLSNINFV